MDFIKIGNYIFAVNTIERIFIHEERNGDDAPSYVIYVTTHNKEIRTIECETKYQAECELDEIYKMLNTEIIKEK
jgi:hypothetical protein